MDFENEIKIIKERNQRVEADKAWEISWTRKITVALLTYVVIVIFLIIAKFPKPFLNAVVPTVGFVLSTLSMSLVKRAWLKYHV
ncbi:MAG: hypothetical protein WCW27_04275 [Patescibacteria group bacterium]|jgi:hypothetical protein